MAKLEQSRGMKRPASKDSAWQPRSGPSRYAITFGEVAILHVGGRELGDGRRPHGFTVAELAIARDRINQTGGVADLVMVNDALPMELRAENEAATLHIRDGVGMLLAEPGAADRMLREQEGISYDRKFWHARQRKTLNKRARFNVVFGDAGEGASEDYRECTVIPFGELPALQAFRVALPTWFGEKAASLCAEGNHYYEVGSGIGFHGDAERKIVMCASLGAASTLRYRWRRPSSSDPFGAPVDLRLAHGDIYVMSEKATGFDWMKRSTYRVVHAAGHQRYIGAGYA